MIFLVVEKDNEYCGTLAGIGPRTQGNVVLLAATHSSVA